VRVQLYLQRAAERSIRNRAACSCVDFSLSTPIGKRNQTSRLLCFLILFLCASSFGLDTERHINQFAHTSWTSKDGAPSIVQALAQTDDGFLWLGTPDGLYRFDGVTFERFENPSWSAFPVLNIRSLLAVPDGSLWVGFAFGVVSAIRSGNAINYTAADGVPDGRVLNLAQDRAGTIWASTTGGLARLKGNRWEEVGKDWNFPGKVAYGMFVDRRGTLWVASENTIVFLPAGTRKFQPTGAHVGQVLQIAEATNGKLWMAETTRSVHRVPLKTGQRPLDDTEVRVGSVAILFDRDGALWITTLGDGMRRAPAPETLRGKIGQLSTAVESFTTKDGLSDDSINAILQDHEGNIWVGTHKGLDRFRKTNLVPIPLPFSVTQAVLAPGDNGDVWVYSDGHMIRMQGGQAYEVTTLDRFQDPLGGSYRGLDGINWWMGMYSIYRFEDGRFSRLPLPKELSTPYSNRIFVTEDPSHELWAAAGHDGLFRLKNEKWTKFNAGPEVGKSHSAAAFTDWMGRVWFGYEGGTIVILNGTTLEKVFSPQESPVGGIRAIAGGNGHVWVGGDLGLASFQGDGFHPVPPVDVAQFRTVWGILETSAGDLWLCESRGVIHISSAEVQRALHSPDYRVKYDLFDSFDGLPGTFRDAGKWSKAIQTTDGQIWFAASNGLARIDAAKIFENVLPPPVSIRSVEAGGKTYWPAGRLGLPPGTANLQIDYTALSLSVPQRVLFRYMLEGLDTTWRDAGTHRQAFFTNLSPGRYRFRVMACNNSGVWNERGRFLDFEIAPAWHETNWFRALCVIAFLTLVWVLYRLRIQQVRRQERKLRDVIETMPTFAWTTLPDGSVDFVNRHWQEYTGLSTENTVRSGWQAAVHPEDLKRHGEKWRASVATGERFENEVRYRRATDGQYRWFLARSVPLRDARGNILKWYGISTDIEDRKRAEQLQADLAHVNRVSTMGELTASLAHEIKQPIGAAVTNAEACARLLGRAQPDVLEAREAALEMAKDAKRAAHIIDRVRSLYRKGSPQMDIVDVSEVIGEMFAILHNEANRHSVSMRTDLADGLPKVMADRVQLQQVLMNLMLNGIQAMAGTSGVLTINAQLDQDGRVLISVTDTGVGLPTEKAEQIFDAFFSTKPEGSGMGLAISRSIIESHGGRLWATANSGKGATFHFTLPTAAQAVQGGSVRRLASR
jgi:PAS domain S-box-containing protein